MYINNKKKFVLDDEDVPETPEMPSMEKMMSGWQFDKKFIEQRKVFLWGGVDDKSAKDITSRLLYLDAIDPGKEITFYINSPGGIVTSGMVIYDTMQMIKSPVATVCMGMAASMGSILLSGGKKGKRYIFPHGEVMIHQPSGGGQGTSADLEIMAAQTIKVKEMSARILAENCGQTFEKVMADFDRDYWMDAKQSVAYGIVDKVIEKI
ncbi:MAG: ATP-dependent Clp protease proteolytic subunit [Terrimonas sp.]|uniref:ClpP family protease n=1 Tax=Terrimonas sp. TaxID=1914338 RepID=UPI0009260C69|nr:ATP-dependent Clp protease proteolytic subunit [Terrimonas sp.]MBN8787414.1 ATP-dependent Clp protease proteolytic subunit [Terrimonas sp.]MBN8860697.1 ATP-dependent Clp protease proteolytic subunit [Sphingobacteriales bacterium]OJY93958.1 MAG: ATP-dependent Clp protease proteolytic subunit [Sphingobacteriales bacterium 40-81]